MSDPISTFLTEADPVTAVEFRASEVGDLLHRAIAAIRAALEHHRPVETANGIQVCPTCSRAAGVAVEAPCSEASDILAALTNPKENTPS